MKIFQWRNDALRIALEKLCSGRSLEIVEGQQSIQVRDFKAFGENQSRSLTPCEISQKRYLAKDHSALYKYVGIHIEMES